MITKYRIIEETIILAAPSVQVPAIQYLVDIKRNSVT